VTRVGEPRGEVAIVRQEQQPPGLVVEPAYRVDVLADAREQVDDRPAPLRIRTGGHDPSRLVQQDVALPLGRAQSPAVHPDVVGVRVRLGAHLEHRLAVERHPPVGDEPLGRAPGSDTRLGQDLLQSLFHSSFVEADL